MPSYPLNNITAPDVYLGAGQTAQNGAGAGTGPATLYPIPVLDHINIDVFNGSIYWSIAETNALTTDLSGAWQPEVFMAPGSRTITRPNIVGFRFRAAVLAVNLAGLQAQVTAEAVA